MIVAMFSKTEERETLSNADVAVHNNPSKAVHFIPPTFDRDSVAA